MLQYTAILFLLYRFNSSSTFITRGMDMLLLLFISLIVILNTRKLCRYSAATIIWLFITLFSMFSTYLYVGMYRDEVNVRDLFEIFRPVYYSVLFLAFLSFKEQVRSESLVKFFIFFIFIQALFVFLQKTWPDSSLVENISIFYSTEKVSAGLGRVTGLAGNPNTLAILISVAFFYLFFYYKKEVEKVLLFSLHVSFLFVIVSRAVTAVVLLFYVVYFFFNLSYRVKLPFLLIVISSFGWFVTVVLDNPYYREVFEYTVAFDFLSIPSVRNRLEHYNILIESWLSSPVLGVGPNKGLTNVGDNIYLFILSQWGWLGLFIQLFPILFFFKLSREVRSVESNTLTMTLLMVTSCGVVYETFYNLIYMPIIIYLFSRLCRFKRGEGESNSYC